MDQSFVIGVDFGTDSVRSVLVDAANGNEAGSAVFHYPRWRDGLYCDPSRSQYRQHPLDYVEGLETSIRACLKEGGAAAGKRVKAISIDTTGSTPVAVDKSGQPLSLIPDFAKNPNAMFVLWKDHTAVGEAAEINAHAEKSREDYLKFVGGIYSSEWFWAKLLRVLRADENVRSACYSWVEHCDWIPFLLTGGKDAAAIKRGVCSAGHKALWAAEFNGLPSDEFFAALDPRLKGFRSRLFAETFTADKPAGHLGSEWAERLGLSKDVVVGAGAFDAHMGAVGGQIEPYHLSKVMGTSTCDMLVVPKSDMGSKLVRGICGQVDGSIIPGMIGLEAGQSAFGDTYAWFRDLLLWPVRNSGLPENEVLRISGGLIDKLSKRAEEIVSSDTDELSLDWLNGRRTPDADQTVKAAISGLNLGSDAVRIFKSLVEATCFGAKAIVDRFVEEGIPVKGLIGLGGVARKSPFIMQRMTDILNMPMRIHRSEQTCAAGAAMFAATAAGLYPRVEEAMMSMGRGFDTTYVPNASRAEFYQRQFNNYKNLGQVLSS